MTTPLDITIAVSAVGAFTQTSFVHHLLLQKRNGDYLLVFWNEIGLDQVADSTGHPINPIM